MARTGRGEKTTAERIGLDAFYIDHSKVDKNLVEMCEPLMGRPADELSRDEKDRLAAGLAAQARLAKRRGDRRKFAISCGNRARTEAMIKQAKPHITVEPEDMDADPLAINVANGTLRLIKERVEDPECPDPDAVRMKNRWTVKLFGHDPDDRISSGRLIVLSHQSQIGCQLVAAHCSFLSP